MPNNIGQKLKAFRKRHRIRAKEMGDRLGVGRQWIHHIESGKGEPSARLMEKIAQEIGGEIVFVPFEKTLAPRVEKIRHEARERVAKNGRKNQTRKKQMKGNTE
jgi:transcriptional regulator with XRE-family HTH domain